MKKTLKFFKEGRTCEIQIKMEDHLDKHDLLFTSLSIVGTIYSGKKLNQDESNLLCHGQCKDEAKEFIPAGLYSVWDRWHLNHMRAGTPAQTRLVKELFKTSPGASYDEQCSFLASHNLLADNGYVYGTSWLKEDLPQEVIDYVSSL